MKESLEIRDRRKYRGISVYRHMSRDGIMTKRELLDIETAVSEGIPDNAKKPEDPRRGK
jgi:hypothetical protein